MKKSVSIFLLCFLLAFPDPAGCREFPRRGLFISVIQDPPVLSSRQEIKNLIDFAKKARVQVLFVQVYRANKAWFSSKAADSEPYETCLKNLSEDPFALLIKEAQASGIEVHAWLNLLSLAANDDAPLLKKYGPQVLTRNLKRKKTLRDYKIDDQYFLEPGDPRVCEALSAIVEEIVRGYPGLDGVQFDYIRYPDKNPAYGYTKVNVRRFKKATGLQAIEEESPAWKNWKRAQVTGLLRLLVKKARAIRPDIQVSATGLVPYSRAYLEAFQDWRSWLKSGLVDFVTLMCYSTDTPSFERYIADAKNKMGDLKKVNIAIGAYKLLDSPETFQRQFEICEKSEARACAVLHYGSLLENPILSKPLTRREKSDKEQTHA